MNNCLKHTKITQDKLGKLLTKCYEDQTKTLQPKQEWG